MTPVSYDTTLYRLYNSLDLRWKRSSSSGRGEITFWPIFWSKKRNKGLSGAPITSISYDTISERPYNSLDVRWKRSSSSGRGKIAFWPIFWSKKRNKGCFGTPMTPVSYDTTIYRLHNSLDLRWERLSSSRRGKIAFWPIFWSKKAE
jgi:hypothetical protein